MNNKFTTDVNLPLRLIQYLNTKIFHEKHGFKPPIPLEQQFGITKNDIALINKYKEGTKLPEVKKEKQESIPRHPYVYPDPVRLRNTYHVADMDNTVRFGDCTRFNNEGKSKYISNMNKEKATEQRPYKTTPFMGHGKGMGNVDVESSFLHSELSKTNGSKHVNDLSINRFEDLHVDVQEKSLYPFSFPRGGISTRDGEIYTRQNSKII
jgi:hypothetical protein